MQAALQYAGRKSRGGHHRAAPAFFYPSTSGSRWEAAFVSGGFAVGPGDLYSAARTVGAVRGELACGDARGGGELGSGAIEGAVGVLAARLEMVGAALDQAADATARNLDGGAASYEAADRSWPQGADG